MVAASAEGMPRAETGSEAETDEHGDQRIGIEPTHPEGQGGRPRGTRLRRGTHEVAGYPRSGSRRRERYRPSERAIRGPSTCTSTSTSTGDAIPMSPS